MNQLQSSDLKDQSFEWMAVGAGAIPLQTAQFKARLIGNSFPCDVIDEIGHDNFVIEDAKGGKFRMQLSDEQIDKAFEHHEILTLIVYGSIEGSGVLPICKRPVCR